MATFTHHTESVFKVHWNPLDSTLIASASTDNSCVIFTTAGKVLQTYIHPAAVYCCDWHPSNPNWVVTGCHDGVVRVFDISNTSTKPFVEFRGHTARVFSVVWSPLLKDTIASCSDDRTVRVFTMNVPASKKMITLSGHTHNVRGLCWNTEIPWLLSSGSWDSTIRLWDIRAKEEFRAVHIAYQHMADVYGLATHPDRPFTYVSTSRDTSIRFWTMSYQTANLVHSTLLLGGQLDPDNLGTVKSAMVPDAPLALCGLASRNLAKKLSADKNELRTLPTFLNFIVNMPGFQELWGLAESVTNEVASTNKGVPHLNDLRKSYLDKAKGLLDVKFDLGGGKPAKRTKEAADIHLKLGNIKEYCSIMVELGEWERAIAIAPSYSVSYWQELSIKYAAELRAKGNNDVIPFYVATGSVDNLMSFQAEQNDLPGALLTAVGDAMDKVPRPQDEEPEEKQEDDGKRDEVYATPRIQSVINKLAADFQANGEPITAAAYHLANGDTASCARSLYLGSCIELAYAFTRAAKVEDVDYIYLAMSRRCEQNGYFHSAFKVLSEMSNDPQREMSLLASRFVGSTREIDDFYSKCNLELPSSYLTLADAAEENSLEQFKNLTLGRDYVRAADCGLALVNETINNAFTKGTNLPWEEVREIADYLNCLELTQLAPEVRAEVLCISLYVGFQEACWKNYRDLIPFMVETIEKLSSEHELELPIPFSLIKLQEAIFFQSTDTPYAAQCINEVDAATLPGKAKNSVNVVKKAIETVLTDTWKDPKLKSESQAASVGNPTHFCCPAGSTLPGGSSRKFPCVSIISRKQIAGARIALEDLESTISHTEAVMLAEVCPFSPLCTGERLKANKFDILPPEVIISKNVEAGLR